MLYLNVTIANEIPAIIQIPANIHSFIAISFLWYMKTPANKKQKITNTSNILSNITVPNIFILLTLYFCPIKKALNISPALAGRRIFSDADVRHNGISRLNGTFTVLEINCLKHIPLQANEHIIEMLKNIIYFKLNSFIIVKSSLRSIFTKTKYKNITVINNKIIFFICFFTILSF